MADEANRRLLLEPKAKLARLGSRVRAVVRLQRRETAQERRERLRRVLEEEIWPNIPPDVLGKKITKAEREEILGYGPDGY